MQCMSISITVLYQIHISPIYREEIFPRKGETESTESYHMTKTISHFFLDLTPTQNGHIFFALSPQEKLIQIFRYEHMRQLREKCDDKCEICMTFKFILVKWVFAEAKSTFCRGVLGRQFIPGAWPMSCKEVAPKRDSFISHSRHLYNTNQAKEKQTRLKILWFVAPTPS